MAVLTPTRYSTRRFTAINGMLVAEASDLDRPSPFGRVYDDACDEGLTLVSHVTGREMVFAVDHIERDREGDLMYWDLKPVRELVLRHSGPRSADLARMTVRVYND